MFGLLQESVLEPPLTVEWLLLNDDFVWFSERKIASLSRSELKNWNQADDDNEDDIAMDVENEKYVFSFTLLNIFKYPQ